MSEERKQLVKRLAFVRGELMVSRGVELGIAFFCGYHFSECMASGYYLSAFGLLGIALINAIAAYISRIGTRGEKAELMKELLEEA